ncbi:hypothetical protein [Sanguibacter sp. HDW7]|uniref:DsbA family protein n=1 Tax=Sanguibacter sp. HDW7 TaxID=2714931 RepID=UPI001407BC41|nr:hypothetical protein [Sanguibacter sp. HDW7]QIK82322.1 hypothetical protein G7063_00855 [Sanguibacter sp. HDW7]
MTKTPATRYRRSIIVPVLVLDVAAALITVAVLACRGGSTPAAAGATPGYVAPTEVQNPELPDLASVGARAPDDLLATGPDDAPTALAGGLGLETDRFTADLAAADATRVVADHRKLGLDLGTTSTPAFTTGGRPIVGAQPTQVFEDAFQSALAATR